MLEEKNDNLSVQQNETDGSVENETQEVFQTEAHEVDEKTVNFWNQLKSVGKINQKVLPEDIVFISLRDFEKEEKHLIEKHGIKVITTSEVRRNGAENALRCGCRRCGRDNRVGWCR